MNKHWFKRDDYTAFPYGCNFGYGFCANGDYDVYDYQSTGESKSPFAAQALVQGKFATGSISHQVTLGASAFTRSDKFGDYVYDFAGVSNIYHNVIVPPAPEGRTTTNVFERRHENERAVFVQDIAALTPQVKLHTGLRYVKAKRDEWAPDTSNPPAGEFVHSATSFLLPSVALVYGPNPDWNVYGALTHGLEHGGAAPFGADNYGDVLTPSRSRQVEVGVKAAVGKDTTVSAALFQIRKGLEYIDASSNTFVRNGEDTHRGVELSAQGRVNSDIQYGLSLLALRTEQQGTGDASLDGKRVTDVPNFKSSAWVEYRVPAVEGLKVNAAWQYTGKKAFDVENRVLVPAYHLVDLGAAYATRLAGMATTLRFGVNNVFDKFYWRDVTPALGGYLITGAPRTLRASAQFDF
jgi:iron complex outermembrane receptor protein